MNYVVVVVGVVALLAAITWIVHGLRHFEGPTRLNERLAIALAA
jgi:hypothetical protein